MIGNPTLPHSNFLNIYHIWCAKVVSIWKRIKFKGDSAGAYELVMVLTLRAVPARSPKEKRKYIKELTGLFLS